MQLKTKDDLFHFWDLINRQPDNAYEVPLKELFKSYLKQIPKAGTKKHYFTEKLTSALVALKAQLQSASESSPTPGPLVELELVNSMLADLSQGSRALINLIKESSDNESENEDTLSAVSTISLGEITRFILHELEVRSSALASAFVPLRMQTALPRNTSLLTSYIQHDYVHNALLCHEEIKSLIACGEDANVKRLKIELGIAMEWNLNVEIDPRLESILSKDPNNTTDLDLTFSALAASFAHGLENSSDRINLVTDESDRTRYLKYYLLIFFKLLEKGYPNVSLLTFIKDLNTIYTKEKLLLDIFSFMKTWVMNSYLKALIKLCDNSAAAEDIRKLIQTETGYDGEDATKGILDSLIMNLEDDDGFNDLELVNTYANLINTIKEQQAVDENELHLDPEDDAVTSGMFSLTIEEKQDLTDQQYPLIEALFASSIFSSRSKANTNNSKAPKGSPIIASPLTISLANTPQACSPITVSPITRSPVLMPIQEPFSPLSLDDDEVSPEAKRKR